MDKDHSTLMSVSYPVISVKGEVAGSGIGSLRWEALFAGSQYLPWFYFS